MAFVDDPNSNQPPQPVAGSAPLSQGQPQDMSQEASQGSTGGSGSTPMSTDGQASQGPRTAGKGSGKASSGMYTNIQKYVNKNQPQAQNMAGAVTQNVEKQAESIQNVAKQKKQDQQNLIDQNNQMMNQQKQEAANIIYQQTGLQAEGFQPPTEPIQAPEGQDQAKRFQDLMSGPQGVTNVGNISLAEQQNRANALQQLAASGRTEQGRRNMLKDTFQKQGAYTQGMSGLDQLILGGDAAAREAIVQGTDQTGRDLVQGLQGIQQKSQEALTGYQDASSQFGGQVRGMATKTQDDLKLYQEEQDFNNALSRIKTNGVKNVSQEDINTVYGDIQNLYQTAQSDLLERRGKDSFYDIGNVGTIGNTFGGDVNDYLDKSIYDNLYYSRTQGWVNNPNGATTSFNNRYGNQISDFYDQQLIGDRVGISKEDFVNKILSDPRKYTDIVNASRGDGNKISGGIRFNDDSLKELGINSTANFKDYLQFSDEANNFINQDFSGTKFDQDKLNKFNALQSLINNNEVLSRNIQDPNVKNIYEDVLGKDLTSWESDYYKNKGRF